MKLTTVLLLAAVLQVSAKGMAQTVTYTAKEESLAKVFAEIKRQTGYYIVYWNNDLKYSKPVSVSLHQADIEMSLEAVLKDQPLTFKIAGNTVLVSRKPNVEIMSRLESEAIPPITGIVRGPDGKPLAGVNVMVKGTNKGTISDSEGGFSINADPGQTLIFSSVVFETKEIKINSSGIVNVSLDIKQTSMATVSITNKGYYQTSKELNTGNVSRVTAAEIARQPVSDPLAALQGKVPGLFIQQSSGATGRTFTVRLRGQNSIGNGNDPLYIIDGVPFNSKFLNTNQNVQGAGGNASPFYNINPNDIESIDVLKDADATAIYGSRGANGVILITTKKGRSGSTQVAANLYTGAGQIAHKLHVMNTAEYLAMRREAFKNDNATPGEYDFDLNGTYDVNQYTDWQDVLIGRTARVTDAQISISGGNNLTQFLVSGGYRNEGSVYPGELNSNKGSGLFSLTHSSENKKFQVNLNTSYVTSVNKLPLTDLTAYILTVPNAPSVYNADGKLNWTNFSQNPYSEVLKSDKENSQSLISSIQLSYRLLKDLKLHTNFSYNSQQFEQSIIQPYAAVDPSIYTDPSSARTNIKSNSKIDSWIIEPKVSYNKKIWKGFLDAIAGATFQSNKSSALTNTAFGFASDALIENLTAASTSYVSENSATQYKYNAAYVRLGYNLLDKYIINLTGRRDGSSRFGPGKQFGNFGALGVAWIFSKEKFALSGLPFLSLGKLRGSIGSTGNDQLTDYKYLSAYSTYSSTYQGLSGLYPTQLTNPYFGWERVNKIESSLDLAFLKNKLMLTVSWYTNRTTNQLVGYSLPATVGFTTIQANLPAVVENKGWEFELNTTDIKIGKFSWASSANISFPRNKLVSYPNLKASSYSSRYVIGQPLFIQFKYVYNGIDPNTGLYTFKDLDNDGKVTFSKDRAPVFVGQDFFGGLSNTFKFSNWTLDVLCTFTKQTGQEYLFNIMPGGNTFNQPQSVLSEDRIQPITQNFSSSTYSNYNLFSGSNGIIGDASYIRIKNVALSWNFLSNKKFPVKSGRIYLQCQNLLTITGYKGLDPETLNNLRLPPLRMITAGFQVIL